MSANDGETAADAAGEGGADHVDESAVANLERQGGPGLMRKMIQRFLGNTPGKLDEARGALAANDREVFGRSMHKLRSTTLMMGARRMSALCLEGEQMARTEALDGGHALLDGLDGEFRRIRPWFESFLEDPAT